MKHLLITLLTLASILTLQSCSRGGISPLGDPMVYETPEDKELADLRLKKKRLENRIRYFEREAMRQQTMDSFQGKKLWLQSSQEKEKLKLVEEKIQALELQKSVVE